MYVGGEIADLARIARPSIGVVTAVQGVHLSRIGSLDAIEDAKAELVEALPADGTAVLNADDERVRRMARSDAGAGPHLRLCRGRRRERGVGRRRRASRGCGSSSGAVRSDARRRSRGWAGWRSTTPLPVRPWVGPPGSTSTTIAHGLAGGWGAPHRGASIRVADIAIVDDAYNASPGSVLAALEALAGLPGRKVAVLGEMLEMGEASDAGSSCRRRGRGAGRRPARRRRPGRRADRRGRRQRGSRHRPDRSWPATPTTPPTSSWRGSAPAMRSSSRLRAASASSVLVDALVSGLGR